MFVFILNFKVRGMISFIQVSFLPDWINRFKLIWLIILDIGKHGSYMLLINVDNQKGGLKIDERFHVNFGALAGGPYRAHEMRYPGGDCTSDIWLADSE